jgi:hypothetical protein
VLTIWFRDHGHPDLFSVAPHDRELAAIDQMVLEDLVSDDPHGLESRYLIDDWVAELVELCVTDQVFHETNDCIDEVGVSASDATRPNAGTSLGASAHQRISSPRSPNSRPQLAPVTISTSL